MHAASYLQDDTLSCFFDHTQDGQHHKICQTSLQLNKKLKWADQNDFPHLFVYRLGICWGLDVGLYDA